MYKKLFIVFLICGLTGCKTTQVAEIDTTTVVNNVETATEKQTIINWERYGLVNDVETATEKQTDVIKPIYTSSDSFENVCSYDDVIKYFKKSYKEYMNSNIDFGWATILSQNDNYYYSIFDFDNNGIDEIVIYNNYNNIMYMFTMYEGRPFCLLECIGYHELQFYTNYSLIGDYIIEKREHVSIDYDIISYYKLKNNRLELIEKIFNGYIEDENGESKRKIIYSKDGKDREIDEEEESRILNNIRSNNLVKRKSTEIFLDASDRGYGYYH